MLSWVSLGLEPAADGKRAPHASIVAGWIKDYDYAAYDTVTSGTAAGCVSGRPGAASPPRARQRADVDMAWPAPRTQGSAPHPFEVDSVLSVRAGDVRAVPGRGVPPVAGGVTPQSAGTRPGGFDESRDPSGQRQCALIA